MSVPLLILGDSGDVDVDVDDDIDIDVFPSYTHFSSHPPLIYPNSNQLPTSTLTSYFLKFDI